MDSKLKEIRDLINEKERIEHRLAILLGEADGPKRGRPRSRQGSGSAAGPDHGAPPAQGQSTNPLNNSKE